MRFKTFVSMNHQREQWMKEKESSTFSSTQRQHPVRKYCWQLYYLYVFRFNFHIGIECTLFVF